MHQSLRVVRQCSGMTIQLTQASRRSCLVVSRAFSTSTSSSTSQSSAPPQQDDDEFEARARSRGSSSRFLRERAYHARAPEEIHSVIDEIVRVDHAGEYGAVQIYEGQLAILGKTKEGPLIEHMKAQEEEHLVDTTNALYKHRGRPTVLLPLWEAAGYALGAGTALLGKEAAMACTVAVEEAVSEHYNDQLRTLHEPQYAEYEDLRKMIKKNRDEEMEHLQHGLDNDAELAPMYQAMSTAIKYGCKAAIWTAKYI